MRRIIFILSFLISVAHAQNIVTTPLTGNYSRPWAGSQNWQGNSGGQIVSGVAAPLGLYRRMTWNEIEGATINSYYWSRLDTAFATAIKSGQQLHLGIMQCYPYGSEETFNINILMGGAYSAYPLYLHNLMQAEGVKDWVGASGDWVPNYNSTNYLTRLNSLHAAINGHIDTASYTPNTGPRQGQQIFFRDVVSEIDIRGMGAYGEWHSAGNAPGNNILNYPSGTFPTIASLKSIIDAHVDNYPNHRLTIIANAFDHNLFDNTEIPAEIGVYALQQSTNKGPIGWKRDQWGDDRPTHDDYYHQILDQNNGSFGGYRMDTAIMNRYKRAPIGGEPPGYARTLDGNNMGYFPHQVRLYHPAWVGNGNYGQGNTPSGAGADSMRLGFSLAGHHLRINSGNVTTVGNLTINARWQNHGLAPTYDHWNVEYSLRNGAGTTVWTSNSSFDPWLFLPEYGEVTRTDIYTTPAIAAGTYSLYVTIKDPEDYLQPLPLQITGRDTTGANIGSYFLTNVTLSGGTSNRPPVANAGANQTIVQPDEDAALVGSANDPDGTISTYLWTQVSGPSTATIVSAGSASTTIEDLTTIGNYIFDFTATDDLGTTSSDQVTITVAAAPNLPPVANPGNPQTIQLPDNDAALSASGSTDSDGTIASWLWFLFSGPTTVVFSANTSEDTDVDFTQSGIYFIGLTVTDDDGLQDTRVMQITVVAEAVQHSKQKWQRKFIN